MFWIVLVVCIALLGMYVGTLFFGANSLEVLLDLRQKQNALNIKVEILQNDNARLQKEYFELKGLEP
ncbi:MAG: hypothetical protein K2O85_04905 [Helicobacter sp.]|nr:hypothetical protein [Helicobacter sp.]